MSKLIKGYVTCADTVCLSVLNPDSKPDANQPVFYLGEAAALNVRLVNATGSDITLKSGAALDLFFQSLDVTPGNCKINLPGWTLTPKQYSLNLAYSAASPATWGQGDANALAFQITGVQSSLNQATAGFFQVNFSGLSGNNIPGRLKMPLSLIAAHQPGNADLDIAVGLGDGGIIYVSQSNGALIDNRLLLNIVNNGVHALFSGTPGQEGKPTISVSFVYGNTAGALAPDADKSAPQAGSAWNIKAKESISEGNSWHPTDPDPSGKATDPVWLFQPDQDNHQLIGTGDSAAVQFEFDHIISVTQPGVTLMYVQFSGFKKDDHTLYNDKLFVLPISKEYLPAPGLIHFSSETTYVLINKSSQEVSILLSWNMTGVSSISLEFESPVVPKIPAYLKSYAGTQPPLQYDQYTLKFQGVEFSGSLLATCRAYDANQNSMGDLEQTIEFDFPPVVTLYTGDIQPDGGLLLNWTTEGAATGVTIFSKKYAANGSTLIKLTPGEPLLNNPFYALIANGVPGENSEPCTFKFPKFGVVGGVIPVGGYPPAFGIAVSPKGDYAFVADMSNNIVRVIELENEPPFKVLPMGIEVGNAPSWPAVSPKGDYVFVVNTMDKTVSVIEIGSGQPFKVRQSIQAGGEFGGLVVFPNGDYVFVANSDDKTVSVIDIRNGPPFKVLSQAIQLGSAPSNMAVSQKGDFVFVITDDHSVSVIDIRSGPPFNVLSPEIQIGWAPFGIAVSKKGDYAFVTMDDHQEVKAIEIKPGSPGQQPSFTVLSPPIQVGDSVRPITISPDGDYVFVANDLIAGAVSVIAVGEQPFKVLSHSIPVGICPSGISITPNGKYVLVTNSSDGTVSVLTLVSVDAFDN